MQKRTDAGPNFKKASRKDLKAEFEVLGALVQEHQTKRRKHKRKEEEAKAKCIQLEQRLYAAEALLKLWKGEAARGRTSQTAFLDQNTQRFLDEAR